MSVYLLYTNYTTHCNAFKEQRQAVMFHRGVWYVTRKGGEEEIKFYLCYQSQNADTLVPLTGAEKA